MASRQHEIPTHLNVEDKLLFGLTMRQFLYVLVGASLAYGLWEHTLGAPTPARLGASITCLLLAGLLALARPFGRALEEWLLAGLSYGCSVRRSTWQPREPDPADWRPSRWSWQELKPDPVWTDAETR